MLTGKTSACAANAAKSSVVLSPAGYICRLRPHGKISRGRPDGCVQQALLLDSQSCSELGKLVQSTICDKVYLRKIPEAPVKKWNKNQPEVPTKAKQSLRHFQTVHQAQKSGVDSNKIELACKVVASQVRRYPGLHQAIASVAPNIRHLNILQSLTDFTDHSFRLSGLKTLAYTMSVRADTVVQHQKAFLALPSLERLHISARSQSSAECIPELLQVLKSLPNITSLSIATDCVECCLSASALMHLTAVELGSGVFVDALPARLAHLCLGGSHVVVQPYLHMFRQSETLRMPLSLRLQTLQPVILQHLPINLHSLSLLQPFGKHRELLSAALADLVHLKVLHVGDFLTEDVVKLMADKLLPKLHTFGFRMHRYDVITFDHQRAHMYFESPYSFALIPYECHFLEHCQHVYVPVADLLPLSAALPQLQQLEVHFDSGSDFRMLTLDCSMFNSANFPALRGVTCFCSNSWVHLKNLPTTSYGVVKSSDS